jgi:PAS domain S-box-containing protein
MLTGEEIRRLAFEHANDGIFVHEALKDGKPGKFIEVNDHGCRMTGYAREELLGLTPLDIDRTPPEVAREIGKELHKNRRITFESAVVTKKGDEVPVEISNYVVTEGSKTIIVAIVRDNTERKRVEEAVRESEERYRMLFDSVNDAVLVHGITEDGIPGKFTASNEIACSLYGYSSEEFAEMTPGDINDREGAADPAPIVDKLLKDRHVVFETVDKKRDGTSMPVEVSSHLFEFKGEPVIISAIRDITERKRSEERIRASERLFRSAFESVAVGASMVDLRGRFIRVNKFLCDLLGYSEKEMLSKTFSDVTHPEDVQVGLDAVKDLVSGERDSTSIEKRYVRKDGELVNVIISPTIIRDSEGGPLHFVALFQDVTERKWAEEQLKESLREKDVLLNEIQHRVKNNLQVITSLIKLQGRFTGNEESIRHLEECRSRVKAMAIVQDLLFQSKELRNVGMRDYVGMLTRSLMKSHAITSNINTDLDVEPVVLNAETVIPCGLIINELMSNSLEHAFPDGGGGEVRVSLKRMDDGRLMLSVSDNGIGMPEGMDFRKSETLGLQLVTSIVEDQLRGEIEFVINEGTKFRVYFRELEYGKRY